MPDSENSQSPSGTQPCDDFVRQLRQKAEEAVQASLHHASLSQQYMEVSQKFAQLAEQAGTGGSEGLKELQQNLRRLEGQVPSAVLKPASTSDVAAFVPPTLDVPLTHDGKTKAISNPAATSPLVPELPSADPFASESAPVTEGDALSAESNALTTRQNFKSTRKVVERNRKAKLAGKRVRVKAKKADLQPKQRTATEELVKGRSSIATSLGVFCLVVFIMSMISWQLEAETRLPPMMAAFADEITDVEEPQPIEPPEEEQGDQIEMETEEPVEEPEPEPDPMPEPEPAPEEEPPPDPTESREMPEEMVDAPEPEVVEGTEPAAAESAAVDAATVDNHSEAGRKALLAKFGGSQASESAVQYGLEWLISVQNPQGYWDFINVGQCKNAGTINNPIGGTAYALLPFLAAGQTHKEGKYTKQVGAGLAYLTSIGVNTPAGYDLRGMINKQSDDKAPNEAYYVHGAATLVICEAYGITGDRQLKRAAEGAIKFIVNSQDPNGGGWRYNPQEPGSTSVTAIQVMALVAAKKAGIKINERVFEGVMHYLDAVQVDGEGRYGYEVAKKTYKSSVTAMALLCRMYCGWKRDDGDMRAGVALLNKTYPRENLYTMYFATQVMKNWGGKEWERWNGLLREDLVAGQETEGPAKGSWKPRSGAIHAKQGGRLLTTALATLTLEVYYRYKPLLPQETVTESSTADPAVVNGG